MKNQLLLFLLFIFVVSCRQKETSETILADIQGVKDSINGYNIFDTFDIAFKRMLDVENNTEDTLTKSKLDLISNVNTLRLYLFSLNNYFELAEPFRMFYPFVNDRKEIEFILSCDQDGEIPLKISFKNGQLFTFGRNYTLLTERMKESDNLDTFNENSFYDPNFIGSSHSGYILETEDKEYLFFLFSYGPWWIHHLFDVLDKNNIKYYILYSIYTAEDSYFVGEDGKLKFRQRYFYLRNSEDTSQDKYRIIDIP